MKPELLNPDDIMTNETKDRSNLYLGIGIGITIGICAMIYYVVSLLEAVMY